MPTKRAKILSKQAQQVFLNWIDTSSETPKRDKVIFMLSFKTGARSQEIAGLRWRDVTDCMGNLIPVGQDFWIPDDISKKGNGRFVPMHPDLYNALADYRANTDCLHDTICKGARKPVIDANGMSTIMHRMYERAGFNGCSSHSGRRTFITEASRAAAKFNCSLKDVQKSVGHKNLSTTEGYIESSESWGKLVLSM